MKLHHSSLLRAAIFLLFAIILGFTKSNAQVQTPRYVSMCSNSNGYYEYLPQGYNSGNQTYPLILFLHGVGELGDGSPSQLPRMLNTGLCADINWGQFPSSFTVNGQTFSFIVISPQFINWPSATDVDNVINYVVSHYRVNTSRIYLTGLSMGGGATWEYAGGSSAYANKLAAIVPIAGASYPDLARSRTIAAANLPVWAFHNDGDPTVSVSNTTTYISQINQAPAPTPLAKQTIFQSNSHDAWDPVYNSSYSENGMTAFQWMLQYTRNGSGPSNQAPVVNAGPDLSVTLPAATIVLNGSASDPDGTIASYSWTEVSGPLVTINAISSPATTISNLIAGTYTFRLTVTDNQGAVSSDDVMITVTAPAVLSPYSGTPQTIPGTVQAENYDNGGQNVAYYDYTSANQGGSYRTTESVDVKSVDGTAAGGYNVGWTTNGEWLKYTVNVTTTGTYNLQTRLATPNNTTSIRIEMDGTTVTTITVPSTGGFGAWQTINTPNISLTQGTHVMRVYFTTSSSTDPNYGVDVDYFTFTTATSNPTTGSTPYSGTPQTIPGIVQAENYDNGGQNVAYYDYTSANQGGSYRTTESVDVKSVDGTAAGGYNVGWTTNGEWLKYTVNVTTTGTYSLQTRLATPNSNTSLKLEVDGTVVATIAVPSTGGFWQWQTITTPNISLTQGSHVIRILIATSSDTDPNYGVDIDYFNFTSSATTTTATAQQTMSSDASSSQLSVFPNPFQDRFTLQVDNNYTGTMSVQIFDMTGNLKKQFSVNKSSTGAMQTYLSAGDLPAGEYVMKVQMTNWNQTTKVVKQ